MGKFHAITSSLFVFGTANITFIPTINFTSQKGYIPGLTGVAALSTDEDDFVYSGYLLHYFIYKASNISNNATVRIMEENIIKNKDDIYGRWTNTNNVQMNNKKFFEMSLMGSIINISIYGMKTWKEFFAEAYSKWMTTPDDMKNKSWEILNEFFIEIYEPLQKNNFGARMNYLQNSLTVIDQYLAKSKIIYDTNLNRNTYGAVNLKYISPSFGPMFGLQQLNPMYWNESYTLNALKKGLMMWQSNGKSDINFNKQFLNFNNAIIWENIINNPSFNNSRANLENGLRIMMNDSYTRASDSSRQKYKNFINTAKKRYYSSFDQLDRSLQTLTKYENNYYHQKGSTIFLKDSITAMQNYYHWRDADTNLLKNQLLNLFNITYAITDENFKYFLTGFLFSPDAPLLGHGRKTAAVTSYFFQKKAGTDKIMTTNQAFIVFSTKTFDDILQKKMNSEYYSGWWSSPNIFCTLNHEMGHAIDAYYGMIKEARIVAKDYFHTFLNSTGVKDQYQGNIFGFDDVASYNQKVDVIKIILIIIFGAFCISIVIVVVWGTSRKVITQKK